MNVVLGGRNFTIPEKFGRGYVAKIEARRRQKFEEWKDAHPASAKMWLDAVMLKIKTDATAQANVLAKSENEQDRRMAQNMLAGADAPIDTIAFQYWIIERDDEYDLELLFLRMVLTPVTAADDIEQAYIDSDPAEVKQIKSFFTERQVGRNLKPVESVQASTSTPSPEVAPTPADLTLSPQSSTS